MEVEFKFTVDAHGYQQVIDLFSPYKIRTENQSNVCFF